MVVSLQSEFNAMMNEYRVQKDSQITKTWHKKKTENIVLASR